MILTKENVLKKIGEAEIMQRYLGFPVSFHAKYRNPLRPDSNPGCFFRNSGTRLYFCDYAQPDYAGDCFRIVQILYGCDFYGALQIINLDFNLGLEDKYADEINHKGTIKSTSPKLPNPTTGPYRKILFQVEHMPYLQEDLAYWNQFGIQEETLKKYGVYSCFRSWIAKKLYHQYTISDPQYAYIFPDNYIKIYRPLAQDKTKKFRTNCVPHVIQGYEQLPGYGEHLIITSSLKDVMVLYECGYNAIAPQSENTMIPENLAEQFMHRFAHIHILFDGDEAGIKAAKKLQSCCDFKMIQFPLLTFADGPIKDPADFVSAFGKDKLKEFLIKNIK